MKWWLEPWPWTFICLSIVLSIIIIHSLYRRSRVTITAIPKYYSIKEEFPIEIIEEVEEEIEIIEEVEQPIFHPIKPKPNPKRFETDLKKITESNNTRGYLLQYNKWDEPVNSAVFTKLYRL